MLIKDAPKPMIGKYCRICGQKQEKYFTGGFDTKTGKPLELMRCVNPKCSKGCMDMHGAHKYNFFGFGRTCVRCGDVFIDHS
jgi:hypothetical protein